MRIIRFLDEKGCVCYGLPREEGVADVVTGDLASGFNSVGRTVRVGKLLAPVNPSAILCVGLNYHCHAEEFGLPLPSHPILFMKNPASVVHPGDPVVLPSSCLDPPQVDYEMELAVVIGRAVKDVPVDSALEYVFGYTIGNDVSARIWQKEGGGGQWVRGKSFDTFCPLGPALVTADEIPDPQDLSLRCTINGKTMQEGHTSDMIYPVRELIAYLSEGTTLLPGTVILTGTPSGVGFARTPPVFLSPGDLIEMTIEEIGILKNPVVKV
ncbi:MAG: fumarylacetoacetate hydrolase family protein [Deltaproteobacteria bacterium]|nr:fumarylacetoacetate hydrolase family protein [Deltaproteobacteria bacterium]